MRSWTFVCLLAFLPSWPRVAVAQTVVLDPGTRHQTMKGWETILPYIPAIGDDGYVDFAKDARDAPRIVDRLVDEVGINRVRLEIHSGAENPTDYYDQYVTGTIPFSTYSDMIYEKVNDDGDPSSVDPAGLHLERLDYVVDTWVKPMRAALMARGEDLYVNVCYVDFSSNGRPQGTLSHADNPDEYAELITAVFERLRADGVTPDAFEFVLEPENTAWDGTRMGNGAVAVKARLEAAGFSPEYIGPSTTSASNAVPYYDDFVAVSGASDIIDMLSYHLYRGSDQTTNRRAILAAARAAGVQTGMLEFTDGTVDQLYPDLTEANASAWEKYAGSSPPRTASQSEYAYLYVEDAATPTLTLARHTAELAPYFRAARMGATRIEATDDSADVDPVAFINADGSYAVVLRARTATGVTITGLPDGDYQVLFGAPAAPSLVETSASASGGTLAASLDVGVTAFIGAGSATPPAADAGTGSDAGAAAAGSGGEPAADAGPAASGGADVGTGQAGASGAAGGGDTNGPEGSAGQVGASGTSGAAGMAAGGSTDGASSGEAGDGTGAGEGSRKSSGGCAVQAGRGSAALPVGLVALVGVLLRRRRTARR